MTVWSLLSCSAKLQLGDWLRAHGICYLLAVRQQHSVKRAAGKEAGSQTLIGPDTFLHSLESCVLAHPCHHVLCEEEAGSTVQQEMVRLLDLAASRRGVQEPAVVTSGRG